MGFVIKVRTYATPLADLVTADGSKFIGSAQRKGRNTILQHGSMILSTNKGFFQEIFEQSAPWNTSLCNAQEEDDWIARVFQEINDPKPVIASAKECSEAIPQSCDCYPSGRLREHSALLHWQ